MPHLLIRHHVEDYERWKPRFDLQIWARRSFGASACRIFINADDPHEVLILFDWDDHARARLFVQSDDLREVLSNPLARGLGPMQVAEAFGIPTQTISVPAATAAPR